jgi:hypothetical protein
MNPYLRKQHDGRISPFAMLSAWEATRPGEAEPG